MDCNVYMLSVPRHFKKTTRLLGEGAVAFLIDLPIIIRS